MVLFFGKREPADLTLPKVSIETGVDEYLEAQEKQVSNLMPWARKEVIWAKKREKKLNFLLFFCMVFRLLNLN